MMTHATESDGKGETIDAASEEVCAQSPDHGKSSVYGDSRYSTSNEAEIKYRKNNAWFRN